MKRPMAWFSCAIAALALGALPAFAQQPLKIGFGMSLTGPLAGNGKAALIAMDIWKDDVNARGGILGRKVEFVYYDDQTSPSTVPSIYAKLLDVDKVDLVVSGYGTNVIAPAMPIMMQRNMCFMGLFGLNVNSKFDYDRYFQIMPSGPDPAIGWTQGYFDTAMALDPKPKTIALVGADAEYPALALAGAREQVKKTGLQGRLRQDLSAQHGGLRAHRARHPGHQPGPRVRRLVSARFRGHHPRGQRGRVEDAHVRRRHGGAAVRIPQVAARARCSTAS